MKLLKLNMRTERVCFNIDTEPCCGERITDGERFKMEIHKDSIYEKPALITYTGIEVNPDGKHCWVPDENMRELCAGRYIFRFILDDCIALPDIKFKWGSVPRITEVVPTQAETGDLMPETCCPSCGATDDSSFDCNGVCYDCNTPRTFANPTELLDRGCG